MSKPESFEVTEYGDEDLDVHAVIGQVIKDKDRESPAYGVMVSFANDQMVLKYHTYEMHLPTKMRQVEETANEVLKQTLSHLKKEFKKRTKVALDVKELKELASHTVQKVSLNERYYALFCRVYELKLD